MVVGWTSAFTCGGAEEFGFSCAPLKTAPACERRGPSGAELADLSSVGDVGNALDSRPAPGTAPFPTPSAHGYVPYALDVSSGIETEGKKDYKKMAAFAAAVRKEDRS